PRAFLAMGRLQEQCGDHDSAVNYYQQATKLAPKFLRGHETLAQYYFSNGDLQAAAAELETAVSISPKNLGRQIQLGKTLISIGSESKARKVFGNVVKLSRDQHADISQQVGEAYLEAGMISEAQDILLECINLQPGDVTLYNQLGIAYRKQKKFQEAIENYQQAIKIAPQNAILYYNLGRACYEAGEMNQAAQAMENALKLNPDLDEARSFREIVLKHQKGPSTREQTTPSHSTSA
ncbi:MAG: tetratricopeptide repeat protein, partial [bacterium]|nr:tetratricopeptide repeat protein [bacterium]